jgi:pimeloyl-ACP methyl ester carboxylesterase
MTIHLTPAMLQPGAAHAVRRRSPVVEYSGYLADETIFDLIRAGVQDIVARRGITAPVYVCHSLGCFVGLDAASREPGASVIAINMPASPWHGFRRACVAAARMTQIATTRGITEANHYRDNWIYFGRATIDDHARQRLKQLQGKTNCYRTPRRRDTALFLKSVMLEHRRQGPHMPRVLVLQGDSDPIAPERDGVALQNRLPNSVLVTIGGAHVLPVTHPRDVVRAIEGFLSAN